MSEASNTPSVFYDRGLLARYRRWRLNRRIERLFRDCPERMRSVFTGNVVLSEVTYSDDTVLLALTESVDAEFPNVREYDIPGSGQEGC